MEDDWRTVNRTHRERRTNRTRHGDDETMKVEGRRGRKKVKR